MAERKIIIEGKEDRSTGPSVPLQNEKPRMERESDDYISKENTEDRKKPRPEVKSHVRDRVGPKEDTFWSKTKRAMFGDPDEHLAERVWLEQVIPGAKALLFDSFFNGLEYFFFGESSGRRYSNRTAREAGYTGMYRRERSRDRDDRSRDRDRRDRRDEEVGEIWENLSRPLSLSEVKSILEEMRDIADRSEYVQLDELLKMLGFKEDEIEWTDAGRCWYYEDLRSDRAGYVAVRGGYKLDLPRPRATPGFESRYRR